MNTTDHPAKSICEHARSVRFAGESPTEEWMGEIEVMGTRDGSMSLHIERSHKAKYGGKKWHRTSSYVTISAESWAHLISAP